MQVCRHRPVNPRTSGFGLKLMSKCVIMKEFSYGLEHFMEHIHVYKLWSCTSLVDRIPSFKFCSRNRKFRHVYAAFRQSARNEFVPMSDLRNYLMDVDKIRYSRCFTKKC